MVNKFINQEKFRYKLRKITDILKFYENENQKNTEYTYAQQHLPSLTLNYTTQTQNENYENFKKQKFFLHPFFTNIPF